MNAKLQRSMVLLLINLLLMAVIWWMAGLRFRDLQAGKLINQIKSTEVREPFWFYLVLLLMPLNYFLEALKWKIILKPVQAVSIRSSLGSVFAGTGIGIITPNRSGEIIGKLYRLDIRDKAKAAVLNLSGSMAQLCFTCIGGMWGFFILQQRTPADLPLWGGTTAWLMLSLFVTLLSAYLYLNQQVIFRIINRIPLSKKLKFYIENAQLPTLKNVFIIAGLSMLRYIVFTLQLFLLLYWMQAGTNAVNLYLLCPVYFFCIWFIPTMVLTELGIRGSVALFLFPLYGVAAIPALMASQLIWVINVGIPALAGSALLIRFPRRTK